MRREGFEVSVKRVARIRREEGIKVSKKIAPHEAVGNFDGSRQRVERPGQVWSRTWWLTRQKMGAAFASLPCWTNLPAAKSVSAKAASINIFVGRYG
jgi:hypothetical protein